MNYNYKFFKILNLQLINPDHVQGLINSCSFDLCALEDNPTLQSQLRCAAYQNIATWCSGLIQKTVLWRSATNCRKIFYLF